MGSSRFPGKPMAKINGKPMIGHVFERVNKSQLCQDVVVATCDQIIFDYINSIGGKAIMTKDIYERASDRCAEALLKIEEEKKQKYDLVVMIQGDEPLIKPEMIEEAVNPFFHSNEINITNLLGEIKDIKEFEDRNCIKVVCDLNFNALYFSREPIPSSSKTKNIKMYKQVCVIPFKRDFLIEYVKLEPTPLEIIESVDMMRVLEHGHKVLMVPTKYESHSVDTPEDLLLINKIIKD